MGCIEEESTEFKGTMWWEDGGNEETKGKTCQNSGRSFVGARSPVVLVLGLYATFFDGHRMLSWPPGMLRVLSGVHPVHLFYHRE